MGAGDPRTFPPGIARQVNIVIPPITTATVSTETGSSFRAIKYWVTAWGGSPENTKLLDISVVKATGALSDSVARDGTLPMSVEVKFSGADTILEITNPNAHSITVNVLKFILGV